MVFSSIIFLFGFFPIVLGLYYISKNKYRNIILFIASILFYAYGERKYVLIMLFSICVNYFLAYFIEKNEKERNRKLLLILDIIINISLFFIFKYLSYSIGVFNKLFLQNISKPEIHLPIGISFFTFQAMSYVIDVYRKKVKAEKNIINVGLYISFFPQLIAGPIVRYTSISEQIRKRSITLENFGEGVKRFICGFSKKIILANNFALIADSALQGNFKELPAALAWLGMLAYSLQIFFDFSGYSDMAIGLGKMFGFDFPENFNYPYIAKSVTDFWHRWHISLSQWFRDYVYFPLGGSRVKISRHIFNLFIVWLLTGIWHGADDSFVVWGLSYFCILVFEKYILKPEKRKFVIRILWQITTLFIVCCLWVLFKTESVKDTAKIILSMFGFFENTLVNNQFFRLVREYGVFLIFGILFSTPIVSWLSARINSFEKAKKIMDFTIPVLYFIAFVWAISFLVLGAHNPFIYFNF